MTWDSYFRRRCPVGSERLGWNVDFFTRNICWKTCFNHNMAYWPAWFGGIPSLGTPHFLFFLMFKDQRIEIEALNTLVAIKYMILINMKGFNHQTIGSSWESKQQKWLAVPITGCAIFLGKVPFCLGSAVLSKSHFSCFAFNSRVFMLLRSC